jgi:hypothetical protein
MQYQLHDDTSKCSPHFYRAMKSGAAEECRNQSRCEAREKSKSLGASEINRVVCRGRLSTILAILPSGHGTHLDGLVNCYARLFSGHKFSNDSGVISLR